MEQPRDLDDLRRSRRATGRTWRVAHLSDVHVVGERLRLPHRERAVGPARQRAAAALLARLDAIHAERAARPHPDHRRRDRRRPLGEWAEFLTRSRRYPELAARTLMLPGNHDVNIVDRANPARLDLPTSPGLRLRQMRTLSAIAAVQGDRVRVVDRAPRTARRHAVGLRWRRTLPRWPAFADTGAVRLAVSWLGLWADVFPMVLPPETGDGLGIVLLNSTAETHFSFTNALGIVSVEQARGLDAAARQYPAGTLDRGAASSPGRISDARKPLSRSGSAPR